MAMLYRKLHRILAVLITVSLFMFLLPAGPAGADHSTTEEKETAYNAAIAELETWLETPGEDPALLENCINVFRELEGYKFSYEFSSYYIPLLKYSVEEEFSFNSRRIIGRLEEGNERFRDYLQSLGNSPIQTVSALVAYARGREAQYNGDTGLALQYYRQCDGFYDSAQRIDALYGDSCRDAYERGMAYLEEGNLTEAYFCFEQAGGYADSAELMQDIAAEIGHIPVPGEIWRQPGSIVTFGHYEQDNDPNNGPEAIEWIVLDVQDGKALLISRYALDAQPYNEVWTDVTWETCTLRTWLNGVFFRKAFSAGEQSAVLPTDVDNGPAQGCRGWDTSGGNNTRDLVFLLSCAEADRYLSGVYEDSGNTASRAAPTAYAVRAGAYTNSDFRTADGSAAGWWWLRSPGFYQGSAANVDYNGSVSHNNVDHGYGAVRPVIRVDLESGGF